MLPVQDQEKQYKSVRAQVEMRGCFGYGRLRPPGSWKDKELNSEGEKYEIAVTQLELGEISQATAAGKPDNEAKEDTPKRDHPVPPSSGVGPTRSRKVRTRLGSRTEPAISVSMRHASLCEYLRGLPWDGR